MEAKYEGFCTECGDSIDVGDDITSDDAGGWVHEDCVGPRPNGHPTFRQVADALSVYDAPDDVTAAARVTVDLAARAQDRRARAGYGVEDLPVSVWNLKAAPGPVYEPDAKPQPEYKTTHRWGWYTLAHPSKPGCTMSVCRTTTFIKAADEMTNLTDWKMGNVALGLARRPDLVARAAGMEQGDRALKKLTEEAHEAGGGSVKANLGTAMHTFTENVDWGRPITDVPEQYRPDVVAYRRTLWAERLTVVKAGIERITMTSRWDGVGGKFDRIYRMEDGSYVIGDVKSGKVGYDPKSMYAQLAMYAHGVNEVGVYDVAGQCWERLPFEVRTDIALIMHLPVGDAECNVYVADLEAGRAHLDMCAEIRRHRKIKHKLVPYRAPERTPEQWRDAILIAPTKHDLGLVGSLANAAEVLTPELRALAVGRRPGLPD